MSTTQQKYILGLNGDMAIHFATAVDGTESIQLSPITDASFENQKTALMTFDSFEKADGYKDILCRTAAAQESVRYTNSTTFTPYALETYCDLHVKPLKRELAMA